MHRITSIGLAFSMVALAVALVRSDLADDTHHLWRDPISFFGAPSAPHPGIVNALLATVGVALVAWSVVRVAGARDVRYVLSGAAGALAVLVAVWPIDCSPVDGLCEVMIRGRLVSASHDAHSVVGLSLFVLLVAITGVTLWRLRRDWPGGRTMLAAGCVVIASVALVLLVTRPFAAGQAVLEVLLAGAATVAMALGRDREPETGSALEM